MNTKSSYSVTVVYRIGLLPIGPYSRVTVTPTKLVSSLLLLLVSSLTLLEIDPSKKELERQPLTLVALIGCWSSKQMFKTFAALLFTEIVLLPTLTNPGGVCLTIVYMPGDAFNVKLPLQSVMVGMTTVTLRSFSCTYSSVRELQCKADVGNATIVESNYSELMKLIKLYLYNYCALYKRRNHFFINQTNQTPIRCIDSD